ncbi:MAG: ScyD/ScyE family protein [Caldilineaceae bacterium]|nr:ScyD/ScyE family protein [Caldilineaceae bacterium]
MVRTTLFRNYWTLSIALAAALYLTACQPIQAPPAQNATIPASAESAEPAAMEDHTIAEGLNGPQGILVDADGAIWVIDAGLGGEDDLTFVAPGEGPVTGKYGESARVVRIDADGTTTDVAMLPSIAAGQDIIGGARLALLDGTLYATVGQWYGGLGDRPANLAAVVTVGEDGITEVANTWEIENGQNPDPHTVDTHPYGIAAGPDGMLWVADAGANDLLKLDPATGEAELVAVFAGLPGPFPNPERGDAMETDPVPTGVAFDADGNAYVSLLTGFPFIPGSAKVMMVDADGTVSDYATGLTMLTDIRTAPNGQMYAVQFGIFGEQGPTPNSGAIVRIGEGDTSEIVAAELSFPTSLDFDSDGNAYVTINGVGAPGSGAVMMLPGLTEREGTPLQ